MQDFLTAIIVTWILFRLFRPVVFVQWNNKPQQRYNTNSNPPADGEVKISRPPSQNKPGSSPTDHAGDYVDFEEIK